MKKLEFKTTINAPKEKVWKALWEEKNYKEWTKAFSPDSQVEGDWKEGSEIKFTDGKGNGMLAKIKTRKENEQMSFQHLAEMKDGNTKTGEWTGSDESYYLSEKDGKTELKATLDAPENFASYFNETFPKALDIVKKIAES